MQKKFTLVLAFLVGILIIIGSCGKPTPDVPAVAPCAGKTITVSATTTATSAPTSTNGTITASASGSSGFTYSLNGGTAQASGSFTGLAQGNYTITAKDAEGCTGSQSFTVTATACPTITVTAVITGVTPAANGSIVASASGGTGITFSIGSTGTFQASGTFANLTAGSYNITAKDVNGCLGSASFTVNSASCPTITLSTMVQNTTGPTASNGSITATAGGGVAPYTFSRDNGTTYQASATFTNLANGTFGVVAKDANGCLSASSNVVVASSCPTITANSTTATTVKCEPGTGAITINATGSTGLMYSIAGGSFQSANLFNNLLANNYAFTVRDANGCTTTGTAIVTQASAGALFNSVKSILATNCVSCHGASNPTSGINYTDDCVIVAQAARIKARAVDANPSQMPPSGPGLSAANRATIVNWINAGGKHNN